MHLLLNNLSKWSQTATNHQRMDEKENEDEAIDIFDILLHVKL